MSIALANSGDMQLELIQPLNDAPSLYRDFLQTGAQGIQHLAYWTEDKFDEWKAQLVSEGFEEGHAGRIGSQGRFAHYINRVFPGTVIEISETSGAKGDRFKQIRAAARDWDGSQPIRKIVV
ncbi:MULTISPECIES: VOC family protein [unclassified Variovorax]|uniref:VOC family protein n=1 Tax=unclassified Variovorax TaxID=663243 RepID=UPI0008C271CA|nr:MULTISPECIES: VOC family protein [unclassified Variovorax]SEJ49211.1 Glyoxalase/Bleomycin resistance protein/Dioxygenase superfamily protein [Variovorax sp. OK202]SFC50828.1 Glyoxalase/Bleomycin resistance protein/Dioxygenase superfamily protein [Variovorax sp. OK212]